jgi:hypothetical protein
LAGVLIVVIRVLLIIRRIDHKIGCYALKTIPSGCANGWMNEILICSSENGSADTLLHLFGHKIPEVAATRCALTGAEVI